MRCLIVTTISIAATVSALSIGAANAAIISGTYAVTGSNFASTVASPFVSISESFTISFDNAVTVSQQTAGITLNASTITPSSPLAFTYNSLLDTLIVGGTAATVTNSDPASTDFAVIINNASNGADFGISSLTYSVGQGAVFTALTTAKPAAVPEPAPLALLGTATAIFALRRRRRTGG